MAQSKFKILLSIFFLNLHVGITNERLSLNRTNDVAFAYNCVRALIRDGLCLFRVTLWLNDVNCRQSAMLTNYVHNL